MAEYFEISLIIEKNEISKDDIKRFLFEKFMLSEGENESVYFPTKTVQLIFIEESEINFNEISFSFPNLTFHINTFDKEFEVFNSFIKICFENISDLKFALCSYELNGYLLGKIRNIDEIYDEFLKYFPIAYKRVENNTNPLIFLNFEAQEIFMDRNKIIEFS